MAKNLLKEKESRNPIKREVVVPVDAFNPTNTKVVSKETPPVSKTRRVKRTYRFDSTKLDDLEALAYEKRITITELLDRLITDFIKDNAEDIREAKKLKERMKNA